MGADVQAWGGGLAVCPEGQPLGTEPDPLCLVAVSVSWCHQTVRLNFISIQCILQHAMCRVGVRAEITKLHRCSWAGARWRDGCV